MNIKTKCRILFFLMILGIFYSSAQQKDLNTLTKSRNQDTQKNECGTDSAMKEFYKANPKAKIEAANFEKFIEKFKNKNQSKSAPASYTIPVVFHVFGTSFNNGATVTDDIIKEALRQTNEDFQGLTADWNTVDADFVPVKKALNITFKLANLDANDNPTNGIRYYPLKSGFGDYGETIEDEIRKYAWDNYKYCNVYIMQDLYDDGDIYNSGVAWYPSKDMSDENIARIVYNGSFLGPNTNENFRSVLTHEFGHYLDLRHTFNDGCPDSSGCSTSGDLICDTPPADKGHLDGALNCEGKKTNWQNFMDYSDNYAMYTADQVTRMQAAMEHVARKPLWQASNLSETGLDGPIGPNIVYSSITFQEDITNDGATKSELNVVAREGVKFTTTTNNEFVENVHYRVSNVPSGLTVKIFQVQDESLKIKLTGKASNHAMVNDIINLEITFTNKAFSSHTISQIKGYKMLNLMVNYLDPYKFQYGVFDGKEEIMVDGSAWSYFRLGDDNRAPEYGLKWDNGVSDGEERLKIQTFDKGIVVSGTRDIIPLTKGSTIDNTSNWVKKSDISDSENSAVLVRNGYTAWNGKIAYAGVSFSIQGRPLSYGWIRVLVSADGLRARVIDYAYNEEPGLPIKAGDVPEAMLSSDKVEVHEKQDNNGIIEDKVDFMLLGNESFTNTTTLNQGTHYTISGLPEGLTTQITRIDANKATLTIGGVANSHIKGNSNTFTINFKNAAFTGNDVNKIKNSSIKIQARFLNPYKIVYRKFHAPEVVNSSNYLGWTYIETEEEQFWEYGLNLRDGNSLKLDSSGKSMIMDNATKELTPIVKGTTIGSSSPFFTAYYWPSRYPLLSSPSYTKLNGKASIIGIRFKSPSGSTHYGWMKFEISADGKSGKLLEVAYNSEPNMPIKAGETGPEIPCHSASKLGRSQHLSSFTLGNFSQSSNISASYTDNTSKTIKVRPGLDYNIGATHSAPKGLNHFHWFRVWIDLNKDNDFDDTGELVYYASKSFRGEHTGDITIPNISGTFRMRVTLKNAFSDPVPTPCEYYDFGETEDYIINISQTNPLLPIAIFTASETSVLEKDVVKFTNKSKHSPTSISWSFPGGTPSSSTEENPIIKYNTLGKHDVTLTVTNADGSHTLKEEEYITVTKAPDSYCIPEHSNPSNRYIKSVKLETINNTTGQGLSNGYSDYTNMNTTLEAGKTYTFNAQPSNIAWASYAQSRIVAWIDFSKNNSFSSSEKVALIRATEEMENSGVYPTSQITIPSNTPSGNYRMRIRHLWESNDDPEYPCSNKDEGETEDYMITVINSQTPTAPTNLTSDNITQTSAGLSWNASTVSGGGTISYDIYNGSSKIGTVTTTELAITGLTSDTSYIFTVKAKSNGNESDPSNSHTLTTLKPVTAYCASQSTSIDYESITHVQFGSIDQSSVNTGYGDYIDVKTDIAKGQTTNLSITTAKNYAQDEIVVYIDYNQDGDFTDSGEEVYHNTDAATAKTYIANIAVPTTASIGNTRMRIVLFDLGYDTKNPCGDYRYGEVEDYTLNLVNSTKDNSPVAIAKKISLFPNPTKGMFTLQSDYIDSTINIINMMGQVVKTQKILSNETKIDLAGYPSGFYTVRIKTDNGIITKHIIKN